MKEIIAEDECNDTYGRERMYMALKLKAPEGVKIPCEGTVRKVMEELGIIHKHKRKANGITKADKEARKSDDLIKRDFEYVFIRFTISGYRRQCHILKVTSDLIVIEDLKRHIRAYQKSNEVLMEKISGAKKTIDEQQVLIQNLEGQVKNNELIINAYTRFVEYERKKAAAPYEIQDPTLLHTEENKA